VTFCGAPLSLFDDWSSGQDWNQLLVRAALYRLEPTGIFAIRNRLMGILVTHVQRVTPVIDAILARQPGAHSQGDAEFATKPALALVMITRAVTAGAPARWVAGDEV